MLFFLYWQNIKLSLGKTPGCSDKNAYEISNIHENWPNNLFQIILKVDWDIFWAMSYSQIHPSIPLMNELTEIFIK